MNMEQKRMEYDAVLRAAVNNWNCTVEEFQNYPCWSKRVLMAASRKGIWPEPTGEKYVEEVLFHLFDSDKDYIKLLLKNLKPKEISRLIRLQKQRKVESLKDLIILPEALKKRVDGVRKIRQYNPDKHPGDMEFPNKKTKTNSTSRSSSVSPKTIRESTSTGRLKRKISVFDFSYKTLEKDEEYEDTGKRDNAQHGNRNDSNCNLETTLDLNSPSPSNKKFGIRVQESPDSRFHASPNAKENRIRMYPKPPSGPPLTLRMFDVIDEALKRHEKEVVVTGFSIKMLQEDLAIMNDDTEWLIDVNIDFYLELIRERSTKTGYPSVYVFHSFFFPLLSEKDGGGYAAVEDTTGEEDIFKYDLIFFPVNLKDHWRLVVVECAKKRVTCYDSMSHHNNKYELKKICRYMNREHRRKFPEQYPDPIISSEMNNNVSQIPDASCLSLKGDSCFEETKPLRYISCSDWIVTDSPENIPQQRNAIDCGIFVLQYAEYLSREREFDFDQRHVPYFRKRMMYEMLTKTLLTSV